MRLLALGIVAALIVTAEVAAGGLGIKGGAEPANIDETVDGLRQDPYDMELLISFGTSKGGSAGHLALALRDPTAADDIVYSGNFYADRTAEHENSFYTDDLMVRIPKREYLFKTASTLGDKASFGLDFGQVYKRSVIGVRVYNVPVAEKQALARFFQRMNDDYHNRAAKTEYHRDEIRYGYMYLNCAKTIGAGFKYGAGYGDLDVKNTRPLVKRGMVAAATSNLPTEMAMKLIKAWNARGYGLDVVLYKKYSGSSYVDPHEDGKVAFKDLPNRFPSVRSLDFVRDEGEYQAYDNLFALYVLYNMSRYSVKINDETNLLEVDKSKSPMPYAEAAKLAKRDAQADSANFQRRATFDPKGKRIGEDSPSAEATSKIRR